MHFTSGVIKDRAQQGVVALVGRQLARYVSKSVSSVDFGRRSTQQPESAVAGDEVLLGRDYARQPIQGEGPVV
jgi:hypothetical protein